MSMVSDDSQWYVQKGARIQGPYSTDEVGRFLLLGRVRNTDRVSRDGELWEPVTQVPELIPEELLDLDSPEGWQRYITRFQNIDPRRMNIDIAIDRRAANAEHPHSIRSDQAQRPVPSHSFIPWSLLGLSLAVLAVVLYLNSTGTVTG